ncbi:MAG: hypothetical protein JO029_11830 [Candidatus Eremiobacteraeota bacterium]|nr:hypothetical protein [Candidatus Eremiobacteraeota bacterium]MBV8584282.1 hypothetical protein [Candidatus Eremiobacteraeota bacterium]
MAGNRRRAAGVKRSAAALAMVLSGCAENAAAPHSTLPFALGLYSSRAASASPIKHVVIVMQENRSFDNLFAGFPGADAPTVGVTHDGRRVKLYADTLSTLVDPPHYYTVSILDYDNGKMDGFNLEPGKDGKALGLFPYAYVERSVTTPYWTMAKQYVLADKMFGTEHGSSWTAHVNLIGTTNLSPTLALLEFPSAAPYDCFAPPGTTTMTIDADRHFGVGPFPCLNQFRTMADTLDAAHLTWRSYGAPFVNPKDVLGSQWNAFGAIRRVRYGPDWKNVVVGPPKVLADIAAGDLAAVTWITPDWAYSDHASGGAILGPSWVAAIVNTIGQSKYWNDTAIVITWDEWGGWYDDAVPPQLDFKGLGLRVPCIIVSRFAKRHYVSHTLYEFASIQRFIEDTFDLPLLGTAADGYEDARANSLSDSFDFAQKPLPFKVIPAKYPASYFGRMAPSLETPDDD